MSATAKPGETLEVAPPDTRNALIRATPDGRSVYFVSALPLDPADTNGHIDVYRWDEETKKDTCLTCSVENEKGETITDVNVLAESAVMVSDDFSHVYFTSTAKLTAQAAAGQHNLYVLRAGTIRFVAGGGSLSQGAAQLSTDGNVTAVRVRRRADRRRGRRLRRPQLYRYDDRDGSIECLSCAHGAITTAA